MTAFGEPPTDVVRLAPRAEQCCPPSASSLGPTAQLAVTSSSAMIRSSQHDVAVVDGVPPLNGDADADVESAPFAHVIVIGPISVGVSMRWLTAVVLMATIAVALMVGALCSTLGSHAQFAAAPVLARRIATGAAFSRGDRLAAAQAQDDGLMRARIEQLDDSRLGPKPFTHVIAHLGQPVPPIAPMAAVAPHGSYNPARWCCRAARHSNLAAA